ncbi:MAG TPA: lamin tail domain-containing protein, partial [Tepidisphaeraceae bacterium]
MKVGMEGLEARRLLAATNPVISEILAGNKTGLTDSSGVVADWLELANPDSRQSIDLTNWKLKYKSTVWTIPAITLGPSEYRVIFADSKNLTDPAGELHTNFNLSKSGADLSLIDPGGNVVQSYAPYPVMQSDVSYGVGQQVTETKLVAAGATARYLAPTSGTLGLSWTQAGFNDASWSQGPTGLGFANATPGFAVTTYKANLGSIGNLAQAQSVIDVPSNQQWKQSETAPYINYLNTDGAGEFPNDRTFPGMTIGVNQDVFVVKATGTVHIPSAGAWTFGVNSDDGFGLSVGSQSMAFDGLRGASDTLQTFNFPSAGDYSVSLVFFENGGGSGLELFAAPGSKAGFDSTFRLVGNTASGGLAVTSTPITGGGGAGNSATFAADVRTNVKSAMQQANNASLYTRIQFDVADLASLQTLTLKMAYDDGYVAYLNGVEVARRNAPSALAWNSAATAARTNDFQATSFENVDLTSRLGLLTPTGNVLAIQALNASPTDGDLLVMPELSQIVTTQAGTHFFNTPTPGAPNTPDTWQPDLNFSVKHGLFSQPFQLTLTSESPGATIYYTVDGSTPSATNGTLYTNPITISSTTIVRAVSVVGGQSAIVSTESYIFLDNVINQSNNPAGFPSSWGAQAADYAMDPRITNDPAYRDQLKQGLLSIPTMSIVTDQANLFDPNTGIYSHPDAGGAGWDRPASLEYILPDGSSEGFQINADMQMEGGAGRGPQFEKHSFRFFFKAGYGPTKLVYPLFGDGATDTFDNLTIRAGFNDTWSWGDDRTQFLRVQFANMTELAMGQPASRGTFVNLYVNGLYWGLYNPLERPDGTFSAAYMGGEKEQYDVINSGAPAGGSTGQSWNDLMNFFGTYDVSTPAGFQRLQGNNPDGTRNTNFPDLLDVSNYIDYMLMNFYIGNTDWPGHNYYASRLDTPDSTGFKMLPWDSEMALDGGWANIGVNATGVGSAGNDVAKPYFYLRNNPEFRMMFADHVQRFMFNGGALTPAASIARYQAMANQIDAAVVGESARWGDIPSTTGTVPHTQAQWRNERDYLLNTFFPQRTALVLQQLRGANLFPSIDAPSFAVNGTPKYGGTFLPNDLLTISGSGGTVYYTLDGSDPRLPGGAVSPTALIYSAGSTITLTKGVEVKARVFTNGTWSALADAGFYVDLAPSIRITELMYNPLPATTGEISAGYVDTGNGANDFEYIEVRNIGAQPLPLQGLRLSDGVQFTFPDITLAPNQYVLVVADAAAFKLRYPGVNPAIIAGEYTGHLDNAGEKIELDAPNGGIVQEFDYNNSWYPQTDGGGFSLTVRDPLQDRALWNSSDGWRSSAATNGTPGGQDTLALPDAVVINEVLSHAATPQADAIELYNTTNQPIDLSGWFLGDAADGLAKYRLPAGTMIAANGYLVLTAVANFGNAADPGCLTPFALSDLGGDLYLSSNASGAPGGYRTHVSYGAAPLGISSGRVAKSSGTSDFTLLQTPTLGAANSIAYVAPIVVNEVLYHPQGPTAAESAAGFTDAEGFEFIELYNRSSTPQPLNNFYIGDGIGFSFGWYPDTIGNEVQTLESGATATWSANGLSTGSYTVWAHVNLVGPDGKRRTNLDDAAQYTITYAGGSTTVTVDQNQLAVSGNDAWINLGAFSFDGPATVRLTRGTTGPNSWTVADSVKLTRSGQPDLTLTNPTLNSFSIQHGFTTLAPGAYVVLVSDYTAFDARYHVTANGIPVAGVYTGQLDNNGEWVRLFQRGPAEAGGIPAYEVDRVNYNDHAPWPAEPDGNGPALIRVHVAQYGNDPINWQASNLGGTPGQVNIPIDKSAPSVPASLSARATLGPTRITLTWTPSGDGQSFVDHYVIYRDNVAIGTTTSASFSDTTVQGTTRYSYQVSAVNRDGYESARSAAVSISVPGVVSTNTPDANHIEITFTEPLSPAAAGNLANYTFTGGAINSVSLSVNNTKIVLTTAGAMSIGTGYTLTLTGITTASGNQLPASMPITFKYAPQGSGYILREYWTNIGAGNNVSDLTSNPNFPNNPSGRTLQTSFEGPVGFGDAYGDRFRGYLLPPATGSYTFWISSDDASELWLSTDDSPAHKVKIAYVVNWTNSREWTKEANQQSVAINLVAGQKYYVETLHKEGGGGDNIAVRWQLPGGTWEDPADPNAPIPGIRLSPFGGTDLTPPTVPANLRATLAGGGNQITLNWSPSTDPESGVDHYVIFRDGVSYATSPTTSFTDTTDISPKIRHTYQVLAMNLSGASSPLTTAVSLVPAGIASVTSYNPTTVLVTFTEPVTKALAEQASRYQVSGATVSGATLGSDNLTVTLTTTPISFGQVQTITVTGLTTLSGNPFPTPLQSSFSYGGSILWEYWLNIGGGNAVSDLTSNAAYPNSPSGREYRTSFETRTDWAEAYGSRVHGYLLPPVTGDYTFWIASDDNGELWLSTDDNPAHASLIASVPVWTSPRAWNTYPQQKSASIHLVAGQRYYIMALEKEGGGGDNLAVTWQRAGTAFDGLPISGQYLAPYVPPSGTGAPINVTLNQLGTADPSPLLGGTVDDPAASVTVTVAGQSYAARNNGDGTWTLPDDSITPALADGTYGVGVSAFNLASGRIGFASGANKLVIDSSGPAASLPVVAPNPRIVSLSQLQIAFNEPVTGFDLADLHLTRDGGSDLITGGETLTSNDGKTWMLSGLGNLTSLPGAYQMTLKALGSGIKDSGGNPLGADSTVNWVMDAINASPADDALTLVRNGARVDVLSNGSYAYSFDPGALNQLVIDLGGGANRLTLDFSNGSPLPMGGATFGGTSGANALTLVGGSADDTVNIAADGITFANASVGSVPISLANVAKVSFAGVGGGNDVVNVNGGAYALDADTPSGTPNVTVNVGAAASATFPSAQHLAVLGINGGTIALAGSSPIQISTGSLSITGGGRLDIGNGSLLLDAANVSDAAVRQYLAS